MMYHTRSFVGMMGPSLIRDEQLYYPQWQNQSGNQFQTGNGTVRIIQPGIPNPYSGPDFKNAVVVFNGGRVCRGDVEIHMTSEDWYRHGHHMNQGYDNVILHVVIHGDGADIRQSELITIPTIVLGRGKRRIDGPPCAGLICYSDPETLRCILIGLAKLRWQNVCSRFRDASREDIVFQMFRLAGRTPNHARLELLANHLCTGIKAQTLPVAALLDEIIFQCEELNWVMGSQYPAGHPIRKIPLLALLSLEILSNRKQKPEDVFTRLEGFMEDLRRRGMWVPGRSFLQEIQCNIVLPLSQQTREEDLFQEWCDLPVQNYAVTRKRLKIWQWEPTVSNGIQQGILQLEKDYCQPSICRNCPTMCL